MLTAGSNAPTRPSNSLGSPGPTHAEVEVLAHSAGNERAARLISPRCPRPAPTLGPFFARGIVTRCPDSIVRPTPNIGQSASLHSSRTRMRRLGVERSPMGVSFLPPNDEAMKVSSGGLSRKLGRK
jgi:hypothetical protein